MDAALPAILDDAGCPPAKLLRAATQLGKPLGLTARLDHPCTRGALRRGSIMFVRGVALKNAQGVNQYEDALQDSHVVVVEEVLATGLVVINPDCRQCGRGFTHDRWGRMCIPHAKLDEVWQSTRPDASTTKRAAIILNLTEVCVRVCV